MANNWKDGEFGINYLNLVNGALSEMNDSFNDDIELVFTDKESLFTTTYTDKSTLFATTYTDKPSLNNVVYTDKPTLKNTTYTDKPSLNNETYDDKGINA
jgi:hypothetical protein